MLTRIWIVAPCFHDFLSFAELRKRAKLQLSQAFPGAELRFVVVDDTGGQDPELAINVESMNTILLTVPYNLGHQGAIVFGLRKLAGLLSDEDYVVTLDCDGEDRPEDIRQLIEPLLLRVDNLFGVSVAQRTKRSEGLLFKVLYGFFKLFFQTLTGTVVRNGNFAACRGWFVKNALFHPYFDYCYSSSLLALARQINNVPLARGTRYFGLSKMTLTSLISHGLRMLLPFSERIAVRAIVASFMLLLLTIVAGLAASAVALVDFKAAVVSAVIVTVLLTVSLVVLAASWIFFQTFNYSRAMSLRVSTLSVGGSAPELELAKAERWRTFETSEAGVAGS